jgi:beta-lactamase regulating signal transducer with metallopeptidase domain
VYHLFLEKERMHQFKRFYLLFSLAFSFVISFVTIEITSKFTQPVVDSGNLLFSQGSSQIMEETNYTAYFLWAIYGLVTLACTIRFIRNILKITSKTKTNTIIEYYNAKLVLVPEKNLPHTFLNYIFINETDYENRNIEAELYTHELTHVTQKHSYDILLIEFVKTIFWFNPIFIFYKRAIQLNHEFLADEFVIHYYKDIPFYQSLLISKTNENQPIYLVSNLNFLVTKKRLLMMTKTTTQTKAILKQIVLIPVFATLFYSISFKTVAMENPTSHPIQTKNSYLKNTIAKETVSSKKEELQESVIIDILPKKNNITPKETALDSITIETRPIMESTKPEFPGGITAFYKFIGSNFKVPSELKSSGKLLLTFMIEKDGSLSEIKILKDIGFGTGEEVIRVLKLSPKWIPGKENDEIVRVKYSLPIQVEPSK